MKRPSCLVAIHPETPGFRHELYSYMEWAIVVGKPQPILWLSGVSKIAQYKPVCMEPELETPIRGCPHKKRTAPRYLCASKTSGQG